MGEYGHLYGLQSYLPLVNHFRCPCRYLVFPLGMAMLAAIGFILLDAVLSAVAVKATGQAQSAYPAASASAGSPRAKFEGLWAVVIVEQLGGVDGAVAATTVPISPPVAERARRPVPVGRGGAAGDRRRPRRPRLAGRR